MDITTLTNLPPQFNGWFVKDSRGRARQVTPEDLKRIVGVLASLDIKCRDDFKERVDWGASLKEVKGIGRIYSQIISSLHTFPDSRWVSMVGLPVHCDEATVVQTDQV